jgi:hypothetical protein
MYMLIMFTHRMICAAVIHVHTVMTLLQHQQWPCKSATSTEIHGPFERERSNWLYMAQFQHHMLSIYSAHGYNLPYSCYTCTGSCGANVSHSILCCCTMLMYSFAL